MPSRVSTKSVPLTVRYFSPVGYFAQLGATYVHQSVDLPQISTFGTNHDQFVLIDAAVGYRFPERHGVLSIEARNLFDRHFLFQDENIETPLASNPRFIPGRIVMGRLALSF